jgi:hypothetical protein
MSKFPAAPAAFSAKPYEPIPMVEVESSQIRSIGYSAERRTLAVVFAHGTGAIYHYLDVDAQLHAEFIAAESKGKFFRINVKPLAFDKFPAQEPAAA